MIDPKEVEKYIAAHDALVEAEPMDERDRDDIAKARSAFARMIERRRDVDAARRALRDFERRGGTKLKALKRELGIGIK
jgi:hypothetical protein